MKDVELLKQEQVELKERLAKLVDYVTSEEYYTLSDGEKTLLNQQRVGMELYLNTLTKRIYGGFEGCNSSSMLWMSLLMGMLNAPMSTSAISSSENSYPEEKKLYSFPVKS